MLLVAKVGIFKPKCDKNQPQTKQGLALSKRRYSRSSFQTEWRTPRRLWVKALVKNPILWTLTRTFHCRFALVSSFQDKILTIFTKFVAFFAKRLLCCPCKSPLYHHLENAWLSQKRFFTHFNSCKLNLHSDERDSNIATKLENKDFKLNLHTKKDIHIKSNFTLKATFRTEFVCRNL